MVEHKQKRFYMLRVAEANPIYAGTVLEPGTSAPIPANTTLRYVNNITSLWNLRVLQIVGHLEVNLNPPGNRHDVLVSFNQGGTGRAADNNWYTTPVIWDATVGDGYHPFCLKNLKEKILPTVSTMNVDIQNDDAWAVNTYLYFICEIDNFDEIIRWRWQDYYVYPIDINIPGNSTQLVRLTISSDAPFILKQLTTQLELIQNLRVDIYQQTQGAGAKHFSAPVQLCTIGGNARYPGLRQTLGQRPIYMDMSSDWIIELRNDSAVTQTGQLNLQGVKLYVDEDEREEYENKNNKPFTFYEQNIQIPEKGKITYTNE